MNRSKSDKILKISTGMVGISICASVLLCYQPQTTKAAILNQATPLSQMSAGFNNEHNNFKGESATKIKHIANKNPLLRKGPDDINEVDGYLPDNLPTGNWNNVNYNYDQSTKTLTINGGSVSDPTPIFKQVGDDIEHIKITGNLEISGSMLAFFAKLPNLTSIDGLNKISTSNATYCLYTFAWDKKLTSVDLNSWDVSNVTAIDNMFDGCTSLTTVEASSWQTSNITDMSSTFQGCTSLTSIDVSNWDTSNVTDMRNMFMSCNSLPSLNVSKWNTAKVEDMRAMFQGCFKLNNLDVSKWNTGKVTSMKWMFNGCKSLENLDVSNWDLSSCTNINAMFQNCSKLNGLNVSKWNTSKVTDMSWAFNGCESLEQLDVSNWSLNNCTNIKAMFQGCSKLNGLNVSKWNTSKVTDMSCAFNGCESLEQLDVSNWDLSSCTNINTMFQNCSKLNGLNVSKWNTSKVTDMSWAFNGCKSLEQLDVSNWNLSSCTNITTMFQNCSKLKGLDVSKWNTSKVTDMSWTFNNCALVDKLDVSNWKTGNVTNMTGMFNNCLILPTVDVSNWDTSKVTDMTGMFQDDHVLNNLDTSKWNTDNVTNMNSMFKNCYALTKLDLSSFNDQHFGTNDLGEDGHKDMLAGLNNLRQLTVGKNFNLAKTNLDTPVSWVSVGNGTVDKPAGSEFYPSDKLAGFWNNKDKTETWVPGIKAQITINYVDLDDNNKVLKSDSLSGIANNTIDYKTDFDKIVNSLKEQHYVYDKNEDKLPWSNGQIKLPVNDSDNPVYTVGFRHETTTVKPGEENPATGKVDNNQSQAIKQTIKYNGAPNSIADNVQSLTFNRDAKVDLVTGKTTYLDWDKTSQTFKDVDSPNVDGYDVDIKTVKGETVRPDDKDITKTVTYTKKAIPSHDITINYIDADDGDKVVKTDKQTGKAGTTVQYHDHMQDIIKQLGNGNYEIDKDKSDLPLDNNGDIKLPNDLTDNPTYKVVLRHKVVTLKPGDKNPLTGKEEADQTKEITQTIKYSGSDKDIPNNVQTVKFNRNATVDLVTGKVIYLDWDKTSQTFADVVSPVIAGYSPNIKTVKGETVKPDNKDITKEVVYHKDSTPSYDITINYQDQDGKVIKQDKQVGKPNTTLPYHDQMKEIMDKLNNEGYEIDKDKSNLPLDENGDIKLADITGDTTYKVVLKHKLIIYKHGEKNPYTGKYDDNLEHKVTQTIKYTGANKDIPDNVQTITFTRSGQVDMVTGKVTYLDWNEKEETFKDVTSPTIQGYTPNTKVVKGQTVNPNSKDIVTTVNYQADKIVKTGVNINKHHGQTIFGLLSVAFVSLLSYLGFIKKKNKFNK